MYGSVASWTASGHAEVAGTVGSVGEGAARTPHVSVVGNATCSCLRVGVRVGGR